jgi:signal transduction histidine kinase
VALEAATAERARIAGLLHAGVLQELTVAALQLDAFSRTLPPPADAAARDLARSISKQQRAIREILSSSGPDEGEPQ